MRFREFYRPLMEDAEHTGALLSVLNYLRTNAEVKDSDGNIKMKTLISMVQKAGVTTFEYDNFVSAFQTNQAVQNLVSNYNKDSLQLNLDSAESASVGSMGSELDQAATVNQMAKRAISL